MLLDKTAPDYSVKVSRLEFFEEVFEMLEADEVTPRDLQGFTLGAELFDRTGAKRHTLTETAGITLYDGHFIRVRINTVRMGELTAGEYRLRLFGTKGGEREEFVLVIMQVVV